MRVIIYFCGTEDYVSAEDERLIECLVAERELDLARVPGKGEMINLRTNGVWIEGEVTQVYTHFNEPHHNIRERAWGEYYGISTDDWEILEVYDNIEERLLRKQLERR